MQPDVFERALIANNAGLLMEVVGGVGISAAVPAAASTAGNEYTGRAKVETVEKDAVTLSHAPIPALHWGAMTMNFGVPEGGLSPSVKAGQSVTFAFRMNKDGLPVLTHIEPAGEAPMPAAASGAKESMPMGSMGSTKSMEKKQ